MYKKYIKRLLDIVLSLVAIIILLPVYILISILVLVFMGKPVLFKQPRPGKDENGKLLPDEQRLNKFGKFLRATSLDELPELFSIFLR